MKTILVLFCIFNVALSASVGGKADLPKYSRYAVTGILTLPYAEISEPFAVWYDEDQSASRVDYYDGMIKTIQLAPTSGSPSFGSGVKIVPMSDEVHLNVETCFWLNGTSDAPVAMQSVIPDTKNFNYIGPRSWKGQEVDEYKMIDQEGDKKNTYTYFVSSITGFPVFYEMIGYDSLLGSHYDRYYVEYTYFTDREIPAVVFEIPQKLKCTLFPGPGIQNHVSMNPISEFFHSDDTYVVDEFETYKKKHNKIYESEVIHKQRMTSFRHNLRYIDSINRQGLSYKLAINHLADKTNDELAVLRGKQKSKNEQNNGLPFDISQFDSVSLPENWDWRIQGAVTPVKDQGVCGSCWSFGTTGAIEGAYFVKHDSLIRLSSQNLVDCSWGFGNNGCDGGEDFRAYDWIMQHGVATEETYPYIQNDGYCYFKDATIGAQMTGYVNVTIYDVDALKTALINQGPISISIDAGHKSMIFYAHGVYYEPECGNKPDQLDHSVLLVGYGTLGGQDYWLVKNSWSTYWGNDGYVLMAQKDNNCGVTTAPTYPIVA